MSDNDKSVYLDALKQALKDLAELEVKYAENEVSIAAVRSAIISLKIAAGEQVTANDFGYHKSKRRRQA